MTIDARPDGDDMRQFVCSGVSFDIEEETPKRRGRRAKIEGQEPSVGFGSLRSRAEFQKKPKRKKRAVKKKDVANMRSLYTYENKESSQSGPDHGDVSCLHCGAGHDVAHLMESLAPFIEQIVTHRLEEREAELRVELVKEFQRRRVEANIQQD